MTYKFGKIIEKSFLKIEPNQEHENLVNNILEFVGNDITINGDLTLDNSNLQVNDLYVNDLSYNNNLLVVKDLGVSGVAYLDTIHVQNNATIVGDLILDDLVLNGGEISVDDNGNLSTHKRDF